MTQHLSALRPGLTGRAADLDLALEAVSAAWRGHGTALLLYGDPGIGKTRLAEEVAERAGADGVLVAWATCSQAAGAPDLWPWRRLLEECLEHCPEVLAHPDLEPLLQDVATPVDGDPQQLRFRLFVAAADLLREIARRRRVLLVLDDLPRADSSSRLLLEFLAEELRRSAVAVVACVRSHEGPAETDPEAFVDDLARLGVVVPLAGLTPADTARLVAAVTGPVDSAVLDSHVLRSQGNPLFATELARLTVAGTASGVPESVRAVLRQRLEALDDTVLEILRLGAVCGTAFSVEVVSHVAEVERREVLDLCSDAVRRGALRRAPDSLDRYEFIHPLLKEVLYDDLPPSRRRALHHRTGVALEMQRGTTPAVLAHHYFQAGEYADPRRTIGHLDRAARHALRRCAYDEAAVAFARALEVVRVFRPEGIDTGELLLSLGDARLRAGDWPGAVAAYQQAAEEARAAVDPRRLARAALGLGSGLGGFEVRLYDLAQLELLREARDVLGPDDADLMVWVLARLSVALSLQADQEERRSLAEQAVDLARSAEAPLPLAYALASRCDLLSGPEHRERRLADAREIVVLATAERDLDLELLGRRLLVVALLESGDLAAVDAEVSRFERTAARLRQPLYEWYVHLWHAMRHLTLGRLDEAEKAAALAARVGARAHSRNAEILVQAQQVTRLAAAGRFDVACELCEREFPPPDFPATPGWLAGLLPPAGRRAEGASILDQLAEERFASIPHDSEWVAALCLASRGAVGLGHHEAASVLLELLAPHADHWAVDGIGAACLGPVAAYLADLAQLLGRDSEAGLFRRRAGEAHRRAGAAPFLELGVRPDGPAAAGPVRGTFRREGDIWTLEYAGATARLRHSKGLTDLARLLAVPGREIHVLDLVAVRDATPAASTTDHEDLHRLGDAGPVLDEVARREYGRRLEELAVEIDELERIDPGGAERARAERESLVSALTAAYGLGGRPRRLDDPVERARSTVTQRIRGAVRRVKAVQPALGTHLDNSVHTGTFCSYRPEQEVAWQL